MQNNIGLNSSWKYWCFVIVVLAAGCKTSRFEVKDAKTAVSLKLYSESISFLVKEFNAEKDPIKQHPKALAIAESYRRFNNYAEAEKWYRKCIDLGGGLNALMGLGQMQKRQEKYAEAIRSFEQYQRLAPGGFDGRQQANQCRDAQEWKKSFTNIQVKNLEVLNTPSYDYTLTPYKDSRYILVSTRNEATGTMRDGWTGEKFDDLFVTEKKESGFTSPENLGAPVNSEAHESSVSISSDMKEMYLVRCIADQQNSNQVCHIYYTAFNNEHWSEPVKLDLFGDTIDVRDPYLSKDGKLLLVAADAPGGFGQTDLYAIAKVDTGWGTPVNMGSSINTPGSERYPWLDERGNLYFASSGWPGMGGLDIFKAIKNKNTYREPVNLKYPINSGADDFAFWIDKYKTTKSDDTILSSGYFSSNRAGGRGGDDIYRYEEKWINIFVLHGKVVEKNFENPEDPESPVLGLKYLPKAKIDLKQSGDKVISTAYSDTGGQFTFRLEAETDYKISGTKNGYLSNTTFTTTKGMRNRDSIYIHLYAQLELEKIFTQKMIVIPNIYYDYDKATLRPESKLVLDSIMVFFNDNPDLTIELGSHTDSRGSDEYNLKLSQARAQSAVDYLVEKGVGKDKLIARGYGETTPVNNCTNGVNCTEEQHQLNRRTTFRVASAKFNIESVEPEDIRIDPKPDEKEE